MNHWESACAMDRTTSDLICLPDMHMPCWMDSVGCFCWGDARYGGRGVRARRGEDAGMGEVITQRTPLSGNILRWRIIQQTRGHAQDISPC